MPICIIKFIVYIDPIFGAPRPMCSKLCFQAGLLTHGSSLRQAPFPRIHLSGFIACIVLRLQLRGQFRPCIFMRTGFPIQHSFFKKCTFKHFGLFLQ